MKQVPFARSSLNHDDVFILDTKDKIYQFNGVTSNIQERAKALEVVQLLKDQYHLGTCNFAIIDDDELQAESDFGDFWTLFGGFAPLAEKFTVDDDVIPEETPAKLYIITDCHVQWLDAELSKGLMEHNKCYLLDHGDEVYIWFGRETQVEDRKVACQAAEEFLKSHSRRKSTRITRVIQGYEPHSFKYHFNSWPADSAAPSIEVGRGKVAAFLKQQGIGVKGASKSAPVNEDVSPFLEGSGKIEVWRINGSAKTPVANDEVGKFYSGDCYIILYTYQSSEKKEDYYLCWWMGKNSIEDDRKTASHLTTTMCNSLKGIPVQGRIFQGNEPPQFVAVFQPMVVLKGGLSSGYRKFVEEKGLADETYSDDGVALIEISGTSLHNNKAIQVDGVASSLNPNSCFILQLGSSLLTWQGNQSSFEQQRLASKIADFLKPGSVIKHVKEGTEKPVFWSALGGKQAYTSKEASRELVRDPHLFSLSFKKGLIEEIHNFTQDDLLTEDMMILDTHIEIFVWIGRSVDPKEKQTAFEIGQTYVDLAASRDGRSLHIPLYRITEGNEPCFFTTYFSWDSAKANVQGNSFQKKVMLLFGASQFVKILQKSSGLNGGGATQRADALAALSSTFNPSSEEKPTSLNKSIRTNQGGNTQRASALASLSSALNQTSEKKGASPTAPRPVSSGQGSQRAAALAFLSSAAEETEGCPSEASATEESIPGTNGKELASKDDVEHEEIGSSTQTTFSYEQLKAKSENPATGIDLERREAYLCEGEFQSVFGITKEDFYKLPGWKQDLQKKKFDLF
ncbi:villin-2-like isoform X1 [Silene latifolia]|uniref:villin-2-like isoform X1 n=1 Tax=Silene latifolia TaxID=37657 RepID=UPI003D775051